jgi:hypothetical protein
LATAPVDIGRKKRSPWLPGSGVPHVNAQPRNVRGRIAPGDDGCCLAAITEHDSYIAFANCVIRRHNQTRTTIDTM